MEQNKEPKDKRTGRSKSGEKSCKPDDNFPANAKKCRIMQCLGNLYALNKVQGALLSQMERELE